MDKKYTDLTDIKLLELDEDAIAYKNAQDAQETDKDDN